MDEVSVWESEQEHWELGGFWGFPSGLLCPLPSPSWNLNPGLPFTWTQFMSATLPLCPSPFLRSRSPSHQNVYSLKHNLHSKAVFPDADDIYEIKSPTSYSNEADVASHTTPCIQNCAPAQK